VRVVEGEKRRFRGKLEEAWEVPNILGEFRRSLRSFDDLGTRRRSLGTC
jgi:hypothetical protein